MGMLLANKMIPVTDRQVGIVYIDVTSDFLH